MKAKEPEKKEARELKPPAPANHEILEEIMADKIKAAKNGFFQYFKEKIKKGEYSLTKQGITGLTTEYMQYKKTKDVTLEKYSAYETVVAGATDTMEYYILLILSCLIATVGLYQNSPAVIIGAMIVAPLMGPIFGFSAGIMWGSLRVILEASTTLLKGIILVLVVTAGLSFLIPGIVVTSEMTARSMPTLFDTIVALCCGMVGAFAYVNKKISSAIPGVAISVALMPPLCTIGIGLGLKHWELARGAALLFAVNLIGISFTSVIIFYLVKLNPRAEDKQEFSKARKRAAGHLVLSIIILVLISIPLVFFTTRSIQANRDYELITNFIREEIPDEKIYSLEINKDKTYDIEIILLEKSGRPLPGLASMKEKLAGKLGFPVALNFYCIKTMPVP